MADQHDAAASDRTWTAVLSAFNDVAPDVGTADSHASGSEQSPSSDAWIAVLDELEAAVEAADQAASDEATAPDSAPTAVMEDAAVLSSWLPPRVEEPIPDNLVSRARRIQESQRAVLARLTAEQGTLQRHRNALGSVQAATAPRQSSVYIDVTG